MNPFFYTLTKLKTGLALRAKGYKGTDLSDTLSLVSNDLIDAAVATQPPLPGGVTGTGAPSGTIIAAILAFLSSPDGQALIAALIAMLTGG